MEQKNYRHIILAYLHLQTTARYKNFANDIIGRMMPVKTFTKYMKDLRSEDLVSKGLDKSNKVRYFLTNKGEAEVRNCINNDEFDLYIDLMSEQEAKQMLKDILHATT